MKKCCLLNQELDFSAVKACFHELACHATFGRIFFSKSNHPSAEIVTATTAMVHFQSHTFSYPHLVLGANMFCPKYFFTLAHGRQPLIRNTATEDEVAQKKLFLVRVIQILKIPAKGKFIQTFRNPFQNVQKLVLLCQRIWQSDKILMPPDMTLILLYAVTHTHTSDYASNLFSGHFLVQSGLVS